jgi:DNA-binding response OmpR family regulator
LSIPAPTPRRVLVAEDDPATLHTLTQLLASWGCKVVAARDGAEAWEVLRVPDAPRLAILDWVMPRMDGLEVCRRVRGLSRTAAPYLLMLTGRGGHDDLVAGLEGGADAYLAKPVEPEELRARVLAAWRGVDLHERLHERVRQLEEAPAVREVVAEDHPGLRETFYLCAATLDQTLDLPGLSPQLRVALRVCRALCRDALGEKEQD